MTLFPNLPLMAPSARLGVSTLVDVPGQDKTRKSLEDEIAQITLSLNNLQSEDPAGYYNRGRVKLRHRLSQLQSRISTLPAPVPIAGKSPDASADLPAFAAARIETGRVGVSDLKLPFIPTGR